MEEIVIERTVKTTRQKLHDKGLFDKYDNADKILKDYLCFGKVNGRRRPDLDPINDDFVIQ